MKFTELIYKRRDGTERPKDEQPTIARMVSEQTCGQCGEKTLCAYYIVLDKFFCSDECRQEHG